MLILGLLLIAVAGAAVISAVFALDGENITYLGIDVAPLTVFLIGAATVLILGLGLRLARFGARRQLRQRRETRRLAAEAAKRDRDERDREQRDATEDR